MPVHMTIYLYPSARLIWLISCISYLLLCVSRLLPSPTFTLANINPYKMSTIASIFHHVTTSPMSSTEVAIPNKGTSRAKGITLEARF